MDHCLAAINRLGNDWKPWTAWEHNRAVNSCARMTLTALSIQFFGIVQRWLCPFSCQGWATGSHPGKCVWIDWCMGWSVMPCIYAFSCWIVLCVCVIYALHMSCVSVCVCVCVHRFFLQNQRHRFHHMSQRWFILVQPRSAKKSKRLAWQTGTMCASTGCVHQNLESQWRDDVFTFFSWERLLASWEDVCTSLLSPW